MTLLLVIARIFHELLSRDHEDGCATWQLVPRCWFRGVPERYVAGADTRGRQEGRPYPWLLQVIHEISGLAFGLHWVLEFPADSEPQEVFYGRERANVE